MPADFNGGCDGVAGMCVYGSDRDGRRKFRLGDINTDPVYKSIDTYVYACIDVDAYVCVYLPCRTQDTFPVDIFQAAIPAVLGGRELFPPPPPLLGVNVVGVRGSLSPAPAWAEENPDSSFWPGPARFGVKEEKDANDTRPPPEVSGWACPAPREGDWNDDDEEVDDEETKFSSANVPPSSSFS